MNPVLEQLIELSGLSPIFARTVVIRAITRSGFTPEAITRKDVERVLPELKRALAVYLGEDAVNAVAIAIRRKLVAA